MTTFHSPIEATFFARDITHGTDWNGTPGATPVGGPGGRGIGGVSFVEAVTLAVADPNGAMYLTAQGSGGGGVIMNFGQLSFRGGIPSGYFPGWPSLTTGLANWDPGTAQGSAVVQPDGVTVNFPVVDGIVQSSSGWRSGRFYVEYVTTQIIFTNFTGAGVARLAPDKDFWIGNGAMNAMDNNGGALVVGGFLGNGFQGRLASESVPITTPNPVTNQGAGNVVVGLAINMSPSYAFRPASYNPVNLPRGLCCPVTLDPRWNKYVM